MKNPEYVQFNPMHNSLNYSPMKYQYILKLNFFNEIITVRELTPIKATHKFKNIENIDEYNKSIKIIMNRNDNCFK